MPMRSRAPPSTSIHSGNTRLFSAASGATRPVTLRHSATKPSRLAARPARRSQRRPLAADGAHARCGGQQQGHQAVDQPHRPAGVAQRRQARQHLGGGRVQHLGVAEVLLQPDEDGAEQHGRQQQRSAADAGGGLPGGRAWLGHSRLRWTPRFGMPAVCAAPLPAARTAGASALIRRASLDPTPGAKPRLPPRCWSTSWASWAGVAWRRTGSSWPPGSTQPGSPRRRNAYPPRRWTGCRPRPNNSPATPTWACTAPRAATPVRWASWAMRC